MFLATFLSNWDIVIQFFEQNYKCDLTNFLFINNLKITLPIWASSLSSINQTQHDTKPIITVYFSLEYNLLYQLWKRHGLQDASFVQLMVWIFVLVYLESNLLDVLPDFNTQSLLCFIFVIYIKNRTSIKLNTLCELIDNLVKCFIILNSENLTLKPWYIYRMYFICIILRNIWIIICLFLFISILPQIIQCSF